MDTTDFGEIINPNISEHFGLIKPIEIYFDSEAESIFIYIYGNLPLKSNDTEGQLDELSSDSYLLKIIISKDKVNKILIPGGYLYSYGWLNCRTFWPL